MPPTLIGLPRELRVEIYDYISNSSTALADSLPLNILPSGTRKYTYGMHSLLKVNRLLRRETLDHVKNSETYLVSQRYRAFTDLHNMTLWKPAPIPKHTQRLYLRVYIAVPRRVASPIAHAAQIASMRARRSISGDNSWMDEFPKVFDVLTSMLRPCLDLKDLVLEILIKRQESEFGHGHESTERRDIVSAELQNICKAEMEQIVQRLPRTRRYAIIGSKFMRRKPGQQWTRHCLIPQCVTACHCHVPFGNTCVEDWEDLVGDLTRRKPEEWLGTLVSES
jgi:hypothetical protein